METSDLRTEEERGTETVNATALRCARAITTDSLSLDRAHPRSSTPRLKGGGGGPPHRRTHRNAPLPGHQPQAPGAPPARPEQPPGLTGCGQRLGRPAAGRAGAEAALVVLELRAGPAALRQSRSAAAAAPPLPAPAPPRPLKDPVPPPPPPARCCPTGAAALPKGHGSAGGARFDGITTAPAGGGDEPLKTGGGALASGARKARPVQGLQPPDPAPGDTAGGSRCPQPTGRLPPLPDPLQAPGPPTPPVPGPVPARPPRPPYPGGGARARGPTRRTHRPRDPPPAAERAFRMSPRLASLAELVAQCITGVVVAPLAAPRRRSSNGHRISRQPLRALPDSARLGRLIRALRRARPIGSRRGRTAGADWPDSASQEKEGSQPGEAGLK
ncbi:basic proline-rich protein-like [Empidonax traillii]|uniref:basic proline-rich protein-like n=1 Tax=Empidonax traillii TaxID=164674 RepID=UPI000FFD8852|nr:basic proline-rich protein-like [Empidonax traillii]